MDLSEKDKQNKSSFLMIDRDTRRHKLDNNIKNRGFEVMREKMDIGDFDLVKWLEIHCE
jgi:hypothetical protein